MNIVFFHGNGIVPTAGGISRITDILGTLLKSKGNNVWYIGAQNKHRGVEYYEWQFFLPSPRLFEGVNIDYFTTFVREHNVDIVINQCALDPNSAKFLHMCKRIAPFLLVSCFHNSILTPIYNGAYQKEYILKKKGMGWLFELMKTRMITSLLVQIYIFKHRRRYRSTLDNSDRVVMLNNGQIPELYRMCGIKSSDKVVVIPNGIDLNNPTSTQKDKTVLWVGTFDYSIKRPDNMLYIWRKIEDKYPDWKLQMLGNGPSWEEMKCLAQKLELKNVLFEGRVLPEEYYKKAAICCVTSVHEAFPMVILEAQREGCIPVVNNSFTSAQVLVEDGVNGYLVPAFDNMSFAEKLDCLLSNDEMIDNMRQSLFKNITRFSLDAIYEHWCKLLNDTL